MFKAPIKVLHPLLTATQESNYLGTEYFGAFPFQGTILAHSNEAEWQQFKIEQEQRGLPRPHLRRQGALLPAGQRRSADLREAAARERTGRCRLRARDADHPEPLHHADALKLEHENSSLYSKLRVYDGENLKDTDPKARSVQEYREAAGVDEGMNGVSAPASPSRCCPRPSTSIRPRSPPIRYT